MWHKVSVKTLHRILALIQLVLVLPAAVFMSALFLREVQPVAQTGRVIDWFSHHVVLGLYVFLIAMPLAALLVGGVVLLGSWSRNAELRQATLQLLSTARAHVASLVIATTTMVAGGVLAIVAMHMITE